MLLFISAVRTGNLTNFNKALETHKLQFEKDNTYKLIERLRHNVIKAGVRMVNLSYLKISLDDVAKKLLLDSREEAEYIVAKVSNQLFVRYFHSAILLLYFVTYFLSEIPFSHSH